MGSYLENYKKQLEEDKHKEEKEFEMPKFEDNEIKSFASNVDVEDVKKKVKEMEDDPYDMSNIYKKFNREYPKVTEKEYEEKGLLKTDEDVHVVIKRIYCPVCGKELISKNPIIYNPYTKEKIAKYDCECGYKCNHEYAYPRVAYINSKGEEIKAFAD